MYPLAGAYGLGLGHLAGAMTTLRPPAMIPRFEHGSRENRISLPSFTTRRYINRNSARMSTARTMRRIRSSRKRSRRGRRRRQIIRRSPRGLPAQMIRRVRTVFNVGWNLAAASAIVVNNVKLNSAYDPSGDFGSGQPYLHDQLSALYRKYQVLGWAIKLEIVTTDNVYPLVIGFTPLTTSTALTSYQHYKEIGSTVSVLVTPDMDKAYLTAKGSVRRALSPSGSYRAVDDLQALIGADPAKLQYGHCWAQAVDAGVDAGEVKIVFTLTQLVRYFDRDTVARS